MPHRPFPAAPSRRDLLLGGGLGLGLMLAGCGGRAGGSAPMLRAATYKGGSDSSAMLRLAGLKPEGYRVDYSSFQSGHLIIEALNAGSIDYGSMSEIPPVFAAASSVQSFRQIAVMQGPVTNQVVLVPRGSQIGDLAGLRGKRVGYVRATTAHYFLLQMLHSVGLDWGDITPIAMSVSDGAAAFENGALDAWAIYGYPIQRAVATQGARVLRNAKGFLSGNYIVTARADALADPRMADVIGRYLVLSNRAFKWIAAHSDEWTGFVAKEIGVPLAYVRDDYAHADARYALRPVTAEAITSQQRVADVFAAQKLIPHAVDVRPLWDDRYNMLIQKEA